MSDDLPRNPLDHHLLEPLECPHCGNPTTPNLLADGSLICSCPAQRGLPPPEGRLGLPPPVDDPTFVSPAGEAERAARARDLPGEAGRFGTDVATESYRLMGPPPGRDEGGGKP